MRLIASLLIFLGMTFTALAQTDAPEPDISSKTLDNGLRVVVIPDRRAPVVTHMIWYKVGGADDPVGKSGIAHFFEHMMFKETSNHKKGEFSGAVAEIGGQENAFTSSDYTAYYQKVAPSALPTMMRFEADRMRNLVLTDEQILPEREVILEERSSRVDTSPAAILSEFVSAAQYVNHPYGRPVIGWENEIRKLDREALTAFYDKWYQPWNAIVVVAGDVEPDTVFEMAANTYGKIVASTEPSERNWTSDPEPVVAKTLSYSDPRVTTPSWQRRFHAPSYMTAEPGEAEALDLLASILGGSVTSRIHKNIILENKLAVSAGAYYRGTSRADGFIGIYGSPRGDTELETLVAALDREVERLVSDGVSQEELDRARQAFIRSIIYSQDSQVALARIFGSVLSIGGTVEDFTQWPERLRSVTVEDVNEVARKYLKENRSVTSYLLPEQG
jgi:zinc protease